MAKQGRRVTGDTPLAVPAGRARVRMYRQGLGDCFLIQFPREGGGPPFTIMVDCGVIVGTPDGAAFMRRVVEDIIATTKPAFTAEEGTPHVDILVVTHEHADHVSGFTQARDLFAPAGEKADGRLTVGEVWTAWTEKPGDHLGETLKDGLRELVKRAREAAKKLKADAAKPSGDQEEAMRMSRMAGEVDEVLSFFGADAGGDGEDSPDMGETAAALAFAKKLGARRRFLEPGTIEPTPPGCDRSVRIYVLGPPRDPLLLNKTDPRSEGYHLAAGAFSAALGFDSAQSLPFDLLRDLGKDASSSPGQDDPDLAFIHDRYLRPAADEAVPDFLAIRAMRTKLENGTKADAPNLGREPVRTVSIPQDWRRIDGAANDAEELADLALHLDGATNNTSLVLAFELGDDGPVLLFVGDAQAGNWLSWSDMSWKVGRRQVTAEDLLGRTVFYKGGHHGSHNATLKDKGLELMTDPRLVAFVPVDRAVARRKRWKRMPLPSIIETLRQKTRDRTVLAERSEVPEGEPEWKHAFGRELVKKDDLYYEIVVGG